MLDNEVLENAIKCYEITMEEPLSNVTYCFLKELKRYRELGTLEEIKKLVNEQMC